MKFQQALELDPADVVRMVYHGEEGPEIQWDDVQPASELSEEVDWLEYSKQPMRSHREYVEQLKGIANSFNTMMNKPDKDGKTMLSHLIAGSTYRQYRYLLNNSVFRCLADGKDIKTGTTANEAEHRIMKSWTECIYKQHVDRLEMMKHAYALYRMSSNTYKNITKGNLLKLRDVDVMSLLAGQITSGALLKQGEDQCPDVVTPRTKMESRAPRIHLSAESKECKQAAKLMRESASQKQLHLDVAKKRKKIAMKISGKQTWLKKHVKQRRKPKTRARKSSQSILNSLENNLDDHSGDID